MIKFQINKIIFLLFVLGQMAGCATISFDQPKSSSHSFDNVLDTSIGKNVAEWVSEHGGASGFYPLLEGMDALGVRLRLAERAEKSLDLQYFLMKGDTAGDVMTQALLKAADRGVRVRFLLDDVFTTAPDRTLMLLNQHPGIQIRMFNPISRRADATLPTNTFNLKMIRCSLTSILSLLVQSYPKFQILLMISGTIHTRFRWNSS